MLRHPSGFILYLMCHFCSSTTSYLYIMILRHSLESSAAPSIRKEHLCVDHDRQRTFYSRGPRLRERIKRTRLDILDCNRLESLCRYRSKIHLQEKRYRAEHCHWLDARLSCKSFTRCWILWHLTNQQGHMP